MGPFKFEQSKLKRLLSTYGIEYHFERLKRNEFGEVAVPRTVSESIDVVGVYHEQSQSTQVAVSNEVRYRTEKRPFILSGYSVASRLAIDDELDINGVKYKVVSVHNVNNIGVYGDIALEVVDSGGRV